MLYRTVFIFTYGPPLAETVAQKLVIIIKLVWVSQFILTELNAPESRAILKI